MNMFAFYAVRGWKLCDLASLSEIEKMFLYRAMENYHENIGQMFGGRG